MEYYKFLQCTTTSHSQGIMTIPLLSERSQFTVYKILNVPVPYGSGNLSAQYDIKHKQIAISEDRTLLFLLLHDTEYYQYTFPGVRFCTFKKAIQYVSKVL